MRFFLIAALVTLSLGAAQPPGGAASTAKASAPIDLTGYWVALVTED